MCVCVWCVFFLRSGFQAHFCLVIWVCFCVFYRVLKGGRCPRGGGKWGTLRIPREDWGTLGNIRED